jgi:hypothetical protein
MTQSEIIAANRTSALEQLEQDKRNEQTKAYMRADEVMQGRPARPRYFLEDTKQEILLQIERENVNGTQPGRG